MTDAQRTWKLIIADDEEEIHVMTRMVLRKFEYDGRRLELLSAYSGKETIALMTAHPDTAIILLDVVMESDQSGLEAVKHIREVLDNPFVRIILRTGQPGQAPEEEVIRSYDINDYKSKTELTVQKLYTSLIAALRAYKDIQTIEASRIGLDRIIAFTRTLFAEKSIVTFCEVALEKIVQLLDLNPFEGGCSGFIAKKVDASTSIIASNGALAHYVGLTVELTEAGDFVMQHIERIDSNQIYFESNQLLVKYRVSDRLEFLLFLKCKNAFTAFDRNMLQTFSMNLAVGLDNIFLNDEIMNTQREVIFTLGEIVETRSKETANHVRRVAEFSYVLALHFGMSEAHAELLRLASPMHDIGKIGIPDQILNKPGKLTDEEFEIIKGHARMGYDILKLSERKIMKTAAIVAMQHHERWNGEGYPNGLRGEAIALEARITSVADVFDALGHNRVYKKAWPEEEILAYMQEQSGQMFDPRIIQILFDQLPAINAIKEKYPD